MAFASILSWARPGFRTGHLRKDKSMESRAKRAGACRAQCGSSRSKAAHC